MKHYRVAILGATGAVGRELLELLRSRNFPVSALRLLASPRSSGTSIAYRGEQVPVTAVSAGAFEGVQIVFMSAGAGAARDWAPVALEAGAIIIDNSSAFRAEPDVPLVIPEINWDHVRDHHKLLPVGNCTAIILMMAIAPLREFGRITRIVASSYQSVSGAGARAMKELHEQTCAYVEGKEMRAEVFPHPIAFNLFNHNTEINEQGYNGEEWKVIQETRKTLDMPHLAVDMTCIRVPVLRAHSISINVEFDSPAPSVETVREAINAFPGVKLQDDRDTNTFPMPSLAARRDDVLVGRLRKDACNPNAFSLFACGDQLRKGAALNAVQIAEKLIEEGRI